MAELFLSTSFFNLSTRELFLSTKLLFRRRHLYRRCFLNIVLCPDVPFLSSLPSTTISSLWLTYLLSFLTTSLSCLKLVFLFWRVWDIGSVCTFCINLSLFSIQGRSQEFLFGGGQVATLIYLSRQPHTHINTHVFFIIYTHFFIW